MREIKFRCYDKRTKIVREVAEIRFDGKYYDVRIIEPTENAPRNWSLRKFDEVELMQYTELKGYEKDIIDVCIFLVSPSNPDNDQHFRGVIEFENGKFVFIIHKYLKFDGNKSEWINICAKDLPFYDEELDEDGTYTVPYFDFLAMSSNLGEFNDDNVEIIGNIYQNPELLTN